VNIKEATVSYETWMRRCASIVEKELRDKHAKMKRDPFEFFRGTYYRWAQLWPQGCPKSKRAPVVLSVGDLHIDSYGTWRDVEGRMCWGIDDFDESCPLPYANDLTRLATSVKIARKLEILRIRTKLACEIILKAYERTLREGGCPIVLAEEETHLEKLGIESLKPPKAFWENLIRRPSIRGHLPRAAKRALESTFPLTNLKYRVVRREAGLGSLAQLRFVAIADCRGGCVAREAKNLLPSANLWINGRESHRQSYYEQTMTSAIRSPDPYQKVVGQWLIRRLSPDSNPIKIEELPKEREEEILLHAMGTEAANVHVGSWRQKKSILRDLRRRGPDWLHSDAKKMAKVFLREWKEYKAGGTKQ
jgi:Uncharacterized protein conserved in bacteria (DUF2252)